MFNENKKKRILVISSIFPNPEEVTKGVYIYKQVEALSMKTPVLVIAPIPYFPRWIKHKKYSLYSKVPKEETKDNLTILHPRYIVTPKICRSLYGFFYFLSILRSFSLLKRSFKPDICLSFYAYPDGFASLLLSKLVSLPMIIACRGSDVNEAKENSLVWHMVKWALCKCWKIFVVSKAMEKVLIDMSIDQKKIKVIPNGIDIHSFYPMDRQIAMKEVGLDYISKKEGIVLYCGRLSPEKGPEILLESVRKLIRLNQKVHLIYVGHGVLMKVLKEQVKKDQLEESVSFMNEISHTKIPFIMNSCHLLCLPSLSEGWPNTLMEALSCGVPVVASNVGGVPEIVTSNEFGLLVPPGNSDALAGAILNCLNESWDKESLHGAFSNRSWEIVGAEILNVVNSLDENNLLGGKEKC